MSRLQKNSLLCVLLLVLFIISFFKDDFTPDYLNSPPAGFLSPEALQGSSRISAVGSHFLFWLAALLYSGFFILLPYLVIRIAFGAKRALVVLVILAVCCVLLYLMVFVQQKTLDINLIPKINRYFHSPLITLFLLAALTLDRKQHG